MVCVRILDKNFRIAIAEASFFTRGFTHNQFGIYTNTHNYHHYITTRLLYQCKKKEAKTEVVVRGDMDCGCRHTGKDKARCGGLRGKSKVC